MYQRKFGLPIYISQPTLAAAQQGHSLGRLHDVNYFAAGEEIAFGEVVVQTVRTPHDAADGVAFVVTDGRRRLGVLTDLGHVFEGLGQTVATLDAVFIESNYDPEMLASGPYPLVLQQRIRGRQGHLSNLDAARLLRGHAPPKLRWACLSHLSEQNNTPELAMRTHREILPEGFPLLVASRYEASIVLEV